MDKSRREPEEITKQEKRKLYIKYYPLFVMFSEDIRNLIKEEHDRANDILFTRIKNLIRYGE